MRVCVCVCVTTMIFQLDVIFFSPTPCELVLLHRCDIVNKESNLIVSRWYRKGDRNRKRLVRWERDPFHITPKQKAQSSNLQGTESKKLTPFLVIRLPTFSKQEAWAYCFILSLLHSLKYQFSSPLKSFYLSTEASDFKTSQVSHQMSSGTKSGGPVRAQCQGKPCFLHFFHIGHTVHVYFIISFL